MLNFEYQNGNIAHKEEAGVKKKTAIKVICNLYIEMNIEGTLYVQS